MLDENKHFDYFQFKKNLFLITPPLLLSIHLLFLNTVNNHGDSLFFKDLYQLYSLSSFKDVFYSYYYDTKVPVLNYSGSEDLFRLFFFLISRLKINYETLSFCIQFLLFYSFFLVLNKIKISKFLVILIFFSNFYITSLGLASIKNSLSLTLFFFSVIAYYRSNSKLFVILYLLSVSISIYLCIIYFLISILHFNHTKIFFKNFLFIKIILLMAPILFNSNVILGKFGGYNTEIAVKKYKIEKQIIEDKKKDNLYESIYKEFKKISFFEVNSITSFLKKKITIKLFKLTLKFVPDRYGKIENKQIFLNLNILDLTKFFIFNFIIFFFLRSYNKKLFFIYAFLSIIIFPLINFQRMTLFLFLIYIVSLLLRNKTIIKNSLQFYLILIVCFYGFVKSVLLFLNLFLFNEIY